MLSFLGCPNGCEFILCYWGNPEETSYFTQSSHYFASLIRVRHDIVLPTIGSLHNYVKRVPLGVVAQITVGIVRYTIVSPTTIVVAIQSSTTDCR